MYQICVVFLFALLSVLECVVARRLVYVGSYSNVIPVYHLSDSGDLTLVTSLQDSHILNPSWIHITKDKKYLYAVVEIDDYNGTSSGALQAYRLSSDGLSVEFINEISSLGGFPCHLTMDKSERYLFASNYGGGSLASFQIETDGSLGQLQQLIDHDASSGAHVHEAVWSKDMDVMQVMDLGLNAIYQYRYDHTTGLLSSLESVDLAIIQLPSASGPRHFLYHPALSVSFVVSELDSTVTCLSYNHSTGLVGSALSSVSILRHGESVVDMAAAELQLSPDGRFLYASDRDVSDPNKHRSSITTLELSVTETSCEMTQAQVVSSFGIHPRHFTLTHVVDASEPQRQLMIVANRDSNDIVCIQLDEVTGVIRRETAVSVSDSVLSAPTYVLIVNM